MTDTITPYGRLIVAPKEELFARAVALAQEAAAAAGQDQPFSWALTGGGTPQEWYRWCLARQALPSELRQQGVFTVSDERHVGLESDQSNFGNAARQFLDPLRIPAEQRVPWPVEFSATEAAVRYAESWAARFGRGRTYDICFLGMGDDAHTASIFPGSTLLQDSSSRFFTAIEVPGKGWRLTITPAGLAACGRVVVMTLGAGKASAVRRVMTGPYEPLQTPSQLLKACAERVVWLVDPAAANGL